jgi:type IV pilus assembly protein PilX
MTIRNSATVPAAQRGFVLATTLLLLVVVTLLAVSMFRGFGVAGKISGNVREKQRALHAAELAEQYAEWWLQRPGNASTGIVCNSVVSANTTNKSGAVCSNVLAASTVTQVPWTYGVDFTPSGSTSLTTGSASTTSTNVYSSLPRFYISYLGKSATNNGNLYQIDSVGYGTSANAVAVVEATFQVGYQTTPLYGP